MSLDWEYDANEPGWWMNDQYIIGCDEDGQFIALEEVGTFPSLDEAKAACQKHDEKNANPVALSNESILRHAAKLLHNRGFIKAHNVCVIVADQINLGDDFA